MGGSMRRAMFRVADAAFLATVFLFQNIILNYFLIRHFPESPLPFLWFLCDFFCLITFALTLYLAHGCHEKAERVARNVHSYTNNRPGSRLSHAGSVTSEYTWPTNFSCFGKESKLPSAYTAWLLYSVVLIAKIVSLFKSEIPQHLKHTDFFGPQMVKFTIGLSAIIFSLLVEAHKDTSNNPIRNAYVNSISYGMALEILDSASFLSLLIGSESGLLYDYKFENSIIALSSMNLMLPAIALYKLCVSDFGRTYPVPLETVYKALHLVLVNGSYLGVRIYLWGMFHTDTSIFIIKNIYSIILFLREIPADLSKWRRICKRNNQSRDRDSPNLKSLRLKEMSAVESEITVIVAAKPVRSDEGFGTDCSSVQTSQNGSTRDIPV